MLEKLQKLLERLPEKYKDLLVEELNIITDNGVTDFMPYFLTLKEIPDIAKQIGALKGPLRGSAGGSLVSYFFGITDVDPIEYNLPLKRFLSVSRLQKSVPDIDLDYPKGKRDQINKILFDKYGDKIAFVATFGMQKLKNSLLDGWRICITQPTDFKIRKLKLELKKDEAINLQDTLDKQTAKFNIIRKSLGSCPVGFTDLEWLDGCTKDDEYHKGLLEINPAFKEWTVQFPQVLETAKSILAIPRQIGQHAAGVVIADRPLYEMVPVMKVDGFNVIAYDKKVVQKLGLIKFDNLGLNTLNFIEDTLEKIAKRGIVLSPWELPEVPAIYKEFTDGNCRTLFQFDTVGGANFGKKMKPMVKKDLFAAVALNRPGALDAKISTKNGDIVAADAYIERMHGDLDVDYLHPDLENILKDTYSVYVYQEQVSRTIQDLLGYSEEEADSIRAAISDKNPKGFEEIKKRLPMLLARGWTQEQADRLYETLLAFARYSFNLSHSVGYGLIAYTTAYLKHFYPLEWWTSVLTHSTPDEVTEKYWPEVYHLMDEPSVNVSKNVYQMHNGRIIPPLSLINGVGGEAIKDIFNKAPFASLEDFVQRIESKKTNKRVVLNLLKAGAMNCLFEDKALTLKQKVIQYFTLKSLKEHKRKLDEVPEELKDLNPYKEFLISKDVLPVSTVSLMHAILNTPEINKTFVKIDNYLLYKGKLPLIDGNKLHEYLEQANTLEESIDCVCYGYVVASRKFSYYSEKYKMDKMALELILDFDGHQIKTVCWPRKADQETVLAKFIKEKQVYLFNLRIANHPTWKFNIIGVDGIKETKKKEEPK